MGNGFSPQPREISPLSDMAYLDKACPRVPRRIRLIRRCLAGNPLVASDGPLASHSRGTRYDTSHGTGLALIQSPLVTRRQMERLVGVINFAASSVRYTVSCAPFFNLSRKAVLSRQRSTLTLTSASYACCANIKTMYFPVSPLVANSPHQ